MNISVKNIKKNLKIVSLRKALARNLGEVYSIVRLLATLIEKNLIFI